MNKLNNDQCLDVGNHAISLFTGGLQLIFEQEVSTLIINNQMKVLFAYIFLISPGLIEAYYHLCFISLRTPNSKKR